MIHQPGKCSILGIQQAKVHQRQILCVDGFPSSLSALTLDLPFLPLQYSRRISAGPQIDFSEDDDAVEFELSHSNGDGAAALNGCSPRLRGVQRSSEEYQVGEE